MFSAWEKKTDGAKLTNVKLHRLRPDMKASQVWLAVQRFMDASQSDLTFPQLEGDIAVEIEISVPGQQPQNFAALVKPLLDGVLSACHGPSESMDEVLLERVSQELGESVDTLRRWFGRPELNLLSDRCPVQRWGLGVQWCPDDHRCKACIIRAAHESAGECPIANIDIYPVNYCG